MSPTTALAGSLLTSDRRAAGAAPPPRDAGRESTHAAHPIVGALLHPHGQRHRRRAHMPPPQESRPAPRLGATGSGARSPSERPHVRVIGMMSGTSFDAVDAAVADLSLTGDESAPYPRTPRALPTMSSRRSRRACRWAPPRTMHEELCLVDRHEDRSVLRTARRPTRSWAKAFPRRRCTETPSSMGGNGEVRGTLQLGPAWIAERTGWTAVSGLGLATSAAGQGASAPSSMLDWLRGLAAERGPRRAQPGGDRESGLPARPGARTPVRPCSIQAYVLAQHRSRLRRRRPAGPVLRLRSCSRTSSPSRTSVSPPSSTGKELFHLG